MDVGVHFGSAVFEQTAKAGKNLLGSRWICSRNRLRRRHQGFSLAPGILVQHKNREHVAK